MTASSYITFGNNDTAAGQAFSPSALLKPIYELQTLVILGTKMDASLPFLQSSEGL